MCYIYSIGRYVACIHRIDMHDCRQYSKSTYIMNHYVSISENDRAKQINSVRVIVMLDLI